MINTALVGEIKMKFKKVKLVYTILLYFITGGLYSIYWFITRGIKIYKLEDFSKKRFIPYIITIIVIFYALMPLTLMIIGIDSERWHMIRIIYTVGFFALIFVYIAIANISADIARYISLKRMNIGSSCSPRKAFWLSFVGMISCIYLQRHINKND